MPLRNTPSVKKFGHFGYSPVGAIIDTDPAPLWGELNGIPMGMQYFYGSVRSAAGDYWWPIRGFYPDKARFLHLAESKIGEDFTYSKDHNNSYSGPRGTRPARRQMGRLAARWHSADAHLGRQDGVAR